MKSIIETIRSLGKNTETKVIKFNDNGVPEFLARLDEFEKSSRKSTFMAGCLCASLVIISGCASGYKGPIQTADGQQMEKPDYNY
jgi:hypothetical protein